MNKFSFLTISLFIGLVLFSPERSLAQLSVHEVVKKTNALPVKTFRATVEGYSFDTLLYISKGVLSQEFKLKLQDSTYSISHFLLVYETDNGDIWEKIIYGPKVTLENAGFLKYLEKGAVLYFLAIEVKISNRSYRLPDFTVYTTD